MYKFKTTTNFSMRGYCPTTYFIPVYFIGKMKMPKSSLIQTALFKQCRRCLVCNPWFTFSQNNPCFARITVQIISLSNWDITMHILFWVHTAVMTYLIERKILDHNLLIIDQWCLVNNQKTLLETIDSNAHICYGLA